MSIIYEALKKVEGQKKILTLETTLQSIPLSAEKEEQRAGKEKKMAFLPAILFLIALSVAALPFILSRQKPVQNQKTASLTVGKAEINPARIHRVLGSRGKALEDVTLRAKPVGEYILEGIVYDPEAPFALINGMVINESDILGSFRIDRISKDRVGMTNIKDNSKVTLSLPD